MRRFVLDTNILIFYVREHEVYRRVEETCRLTEPDAFIILSVATQAEILSFAEQQNWNEKRMTALQRMLDALFIVDISGSDKKLLQAYADIDAYSQGKLSRMPSPFSARNMGKNDLWIAATAYATGATLVTTDADFDHLKDVFLKLEKITL